MSKRLSWLGLLKREANLLTEYCYDSPANEQLIHDKCLDSLMYAFDLGREMQRKRKGVDE